jgi:hypothetical protein
MKRRHWTPLVAICAALLLAACGEQGSVTGVGDAPGPAFAVDLTPLEGDDGLTERDLSGIATGTNFVTAGVGTNDGGANTIEVEVPSDATVEAVFLYWARRLDDPESAPESEILVDGSTVAGTIVGGPIETSDNRLTPVTYRADITGEGLVDPGTSSFTVQDDVSPSRALGASVLVFYDDGGDASGMSLWDGVDFAWNGDNVDWRQNASPVTFEFDAADSDRSADLVLFVGDAERPDRPNELDITIGGTTTTVDQPFTAAQGDLWDNYVQTLTIPAGVTEVTVEPISPDEPDASSLVWSTAALSIEPLGGGGEGCTPGYWRQPQHFDSWQGHDPGDLLSDVFDVPSDLELQRPEREDPEDLTLLDGLVLRGGGVNALIRHAVAALLNASSDDVDYDLTEAEVIEAFNDAVDGGDVEGTKDELEGFNEQGCPLD